VDSRGHAIGAIAFVTARRLVRRAPLLLIEVPFFFLFFGLYYLGRGFRDDQPVEATVNAERVIDFERALGFFWEPAWHHWAVEHDAILNLANFTYSRLHLPVIFGLGALFFLVDMRKYRVLRNTMLFSALIAIPVYHLFPLTPPRLLEINGIDLGFVDTVGDLRGSKADYLSNDYAAMPSYHFGWIALMGAGIWWFFRSTIARALAVAFAAWMWCAIVFTANHYFVDMTAGAMIVALVFRLALAWERFIETRPGWKAPWFFRRTDAGSSFRVPF